MLSLIRPSLFLSLFTVAVVALVPQFTTCFTITPTSTSTSASTSTSIHRIQSRTQSQSTTKIYLTSEQDDGIQKQLAKARKLIEEAKAKVAAQEAAAAQVQEETEADADTDAETEVTASQDENENENEDESEKNKESVIKSRNEETGLITTDGELMAELSELDEWEVKSLMDVFESESTNGRHDDNGKSIADRDVAASIFNLRMNMMDKDYRRVFDKRNFFIGEDN
jgi:hypothetical protein